jgi:hypothetical protein
MQRTLNLSIRYGASFGVSSIPTYTVSLEPDIELDRTGGADLADHIPGQSRRCFNPKKDGASFPVG